MKLLGIACGRNMDNTEILVKEALMAAEETGVAVGFIRLIDLDMKSCTGCASCLKSLSEGGEGKCVIDDDMAFLDEQIMECDGLILGSPVYTLAPSALLKNACERFGPTHDVYARMQAKTINATKSGIKGPDERSFKHRVGAFISVGGGVSFVALGVPMMNFFTFSMQIKIVDQMPLSGIWYGSTGLLQRQDILQRARKLGRNVAEAMVKPAEEVQWMGDEEGICPVCHCNLLLVNSSNPVRCPICGTRGTIAVDGEKISVHFTDEERRKSYFTLEGLKDHYDELQSYSSKAAKSENREEALVNLEKYKDYAEIIKK